MTTSQSESQRVTSGSQKSKLRTWRQRDRQLQNPKICVAPDIPFNLCKRGEKVECSGVVQLRYTRKPAESCGANLHHIRLQGSRASTTQPATAGCLLVTSEGVTHIIENQSCDRGGSISQK